MKEILKRSNEIIFQCPKCTCIYKEDKEACKQQPHEGLVEATCYLSVCPSCGKETSILEVHNKNG